MIHDLRSVKNRTCCEPRFCERLADFLSRAFNKSRLEFSLEFVPVSDAVDVVRKARIVNQLFPSYFLTKLSPGPVIAGANKDIDRLSTESIIRRNIGMRITGRPGNFTGKIEIRNVGMHQRHGTVIQRHIQILPCT